MPGPQLPRKAGSRRVAAPTGRSNRPQDLPILSAQEIELSDGTKIPIKIPEGMPPHQAQALIAYLQANPEAAKQVHAQAQEMLKSPGLANAFMNMRNNMAAPQGAETYAALKDDPDMKHVFEDVVANGPAAFQKYWDDDELMKKISAKMRAMNVSGPAAPTRPAAPRGPPANLHDAAKRGNLEALNTFLEKDSVDSVNERGISALGVAVGFNQQAVVAALLDKGANIEFQDPAGNTPLHYAAGYGRKAICQQLLTAGANVNATNKAGQKPIDAAKMNTEKECVELLESLMKGASEGEVSGGAGASSASDDDIIVVQKP